MSGPDRARVREVFLAACALAPGARGAYLAEACGDDDALRGEVESLLAYHEEKTLLAHERRPLSRRVSALCLVVPGLMLAAVAVTEAVGERSLHRRLVDDLDAAVSATCSVLEQRLESEASRFHEAVMSPEVVGAIETFRSDGDAHALDEVLAPRLHADALGYALLDDDATVLVSSKGGEGPALGASLSDLGREVFADMQRSEAQVVPLSFARGSLVEGGAPTDEPVFALADSVAGVWCIVALDARPRAAAAVDAPHPEWRGDSFVIDAAGRALTKVPGDAVALRAPVRRPDGRPTRAVEEVCRGIDGVDAEGYVDARGVEVVGAWRWRPEWDLGVVTEVERAEAYAALRPLRHARSALLLAVGVAVLLLFARSRAGVAAGR